ncbi:hypothetical protein BGM30_20370 [Microcystis aeruginosa NIES-298]|uniref:Uncharacterized protein n=1 Tax=Microcystis aeruginosa NIES-298 TaxID=449468 RepID=A0A9P3DF97_MICAE|nr:hypothetical protein BGM30_20370 [Microcystis aeruginosa NIES-298]
MEILPTNGVFNSTMIIAFDISSRQMKSGSGVNLRSSSYGNLFDERFSNDLGLFAPRPIKRIG